IGDVTQPLPPAVIKALHEAVDEMARAETFRGYGPEAGYDFLIALIAKHEYGARGVSIAPDEIIVSDGSKSDSGNIQEILAADEAYIREPAIPHSIYEVEGAREVAIEFRSFSKSAGFTGTRCAFTVVPKEVTGRNAAGERVGLNGLWLRRQSTKFNSVPYIIQKGAAAVYTEEGQAQVRALVGGYMENARIIRSGLQ